MRPYPRLWRIVEALWSYQNCSIPEIVIASGSTTHPKTFWARVRGRKRWTADSARPVLVYASQVWQIPVEEVDGYARGLTPAEGRLRELLTLRFWHLNRRSGKELDRRIAQYEASARQWFYIADLVPLCFFPERPLSRFVRNGCLPDGVPRHTLTEWRAVGHSWRKRLMAAPAGPDRVWLTSCAAIQTIKDRQPPLDGLDAEDADEILLFVAHDLIRERGMQLAMADDFMDSLPELQRFFSPGSLLAMSDDFLLRREGFEPRLRTIERDRGADQGMLLDQELAAAQRLLDAVGGPMDVEASFQFVRSFLD